MKRKWCLNGTSLIVSVVLILISGVSTAQTPEEVWQSPWEGVPEHYRHWHYPEFEFPDSLDRWKIQRHQVRGILENLLGDIPGRPALPQIETVNREQLDGYVREKFFIDNEVDSRIPGYILIPDGLTESAPAVLVMHGHGSSKENIVGTDPSSQSVGPLLAQNGYVVMAIDSYFNGERRGLGPSGDIERQEQRANQEMSQFKINLWFGRSLWGMMLRDEQIALDYLSSRPEVDSGRIGASGMSMGSTRAWWLAALDERVQSLVGVACFTRYKELIEQRYLRAHGIYYFVPGILQHFDMEAVMGLIAPRPFLALTGDSDAGSPLDGIRVLEEKLSDIYNLYRKPESFKSIVYENTGHVYTDEMKDEMLVWFNRTLSSE